MCPVHLAFTCFRTPARASKGVFEWICKNHQDMSCLPSPVASGIYSQELVESIRNRMYFLKVSRLLGMSNDPMIRFLSHGFRSQARSFRCRAPVAIGQRQRSEWPLNSVPKTWIDRFRCLEALQNTGSAIVWVKQKVFCVLQTIVFSMFWL